MKLSHLFHWIILFAGLVIGLPPPVAAQQGKIPVRKVPYLLDSGLHDGPVGPEAKSMIAFQQVIQVPDAAWLRLLFRAYDLGEKGE